MEILHDLWWLPYVIIFLLTYSFISSYVKGLKKKLPPGPTGLPFVGYFPFLTDKPYLKFCELRKKYGKIFGLYLGRQYTVIIEDIEVMKEAFNKQALLGRPPRSALSPGLPLLSGQAWLQQKRFLLQFMKDIGMEKSRMDENIKEELSHLIRTIRDLQGEPNEFKKLLASCTNNIILAFTCGRRLEYTDPLRTTLDEDLEAITDFFGQTSVPSYMPIVMSVPWLKNRFGYDRYRKAFKRTMNFIREEIALHKETLKKDFVRDFVDDYLLEIEAQKENSSSSFTASMLQDSVMTMLIAGAETTRTTVEWTLYVLATRPDVQQMIGREIDEVIGQGRTPVWLDHSSMPITQAVINEVFRWRPAVPITLQKCALSDTTLSNYDIPKGTVVLANIWGIHHDPAIWENPDDFQPERFLTEDEKSNKMEFLVPFSIGRRSCPGQSVANVEVFIIVTTVLQRFTVRLPEGDKPNFDGCLAIVNHPLPHKLQFMERF